MSLIPKEELDLDMPVGKWLNRNIAPQKSPPKNLKKPKKERGETPRKARKGEISLFDDGVGEQNGEYREETYGVEEEEGDEQNYPVQSNQQYQQNAVHRQYDQQPDDEYAYLDDGNEQFIQSAPQEYDSQPVQYGQQLAYPNKQEPRILTPEEEEEYAYLKDMPPPKSRRGPAKKKAAPKGAAKLYPQPGASPYSTGPVYASSVAEKFPVAQAQVQPPRYAPPGQRKYAVPTGRRNPPAVTYASLPQQNHHYPPLANQNYASSSQSQNYVFPTVQSYETPVQFSQSSGVYTDAPLQYVGMPPDHQYYQQQPPQRPMNKNGKRPAARKLAQQPRAKKAAPPPAIPPLAGRFENSLLITTQKFMTLKTLTGDKVLNLNDAADFLKVPKRRLYDITNVLEGINVVEKIGKNSIKWKCSPAAGSYCERLQNDIASLTNQEADIDKLIDDCQSLYKLMTEDPVDLPYAYINRSDFRKIDPEGKKTMIALKSTTEATNNIEVHASNSGESGVYQMIARNRTKKPMTAFLCIDESEIIVSFEGSPNPPPKRSVVSYATGALAPLEPVAPVSPNSSIAAPIVPSSGEDFRLDEDGIEIIESDDEEEDRDLHFEDPNYKEDDDLEDFVIPETSGNQNDNTPHAVQTPGRGLYMSPLKAMVDPNSLMPSTSTQPDYAEMTAPLSPLADVWDPDSDFENAITLFDEHWNF